MGQIYRDAYQGISITYYMEAMTWNHSPLNHQAFVRIN